MASLSKLGLELSSSSTVDFALFCVMHSLRGTQLWSVDLPAMLAGSSYRGQFEERLMALLEKVLKAKHNTWLFVDEVHMLGEFNL